MKKLTLATPAVIKKAGLKISTVTGRAGLKLKKYSPEICLVGGIVAVAAGTVLACKATLKVNEIVDEYEETKEKIESVKEQNRPDYTEKDAAHDLVVLKVQTGVKLVKLYAPAVGLMLLGIGGVCGSYGIMKSRNAALASALNLVSTQFADYRKRVVEEEGEDKDHHYLTGGEIVRNEDGTLVKDEDGDLKTTTAPDINPIANQWARVFDETNRYWQKNRYLNKTFLWGQQSAINDRLHARGHVCLNEVYEMLGFPQTDYGAVVGWVKENGDIDFGMMNIHDPKVSDFINEYEPAIWLNFNVQGYIYGKLGNRVSTQEPRTIQA